MPIVKKYRQLTIASAIIATYGASAIPSMATGTPVIVTNTPSTAIPAVITNASGNPVPVGGNVAVTNTPSNPVAVQITNTKVPTSDVNKPVHTPFSKRLDITFANGSGSGTFTVPVGKLLVITYMSADVGTFPGAHVLFDLATTYAGSEVESHLPSADQGVILGQQVFCASEKMTVYADPNSTVTIAFLDSDSAHSGGAIVGVYGYLVDSTAASFE